MVNDIEYLIYPIVLGALSGIFVNIIFYEYRFKKEKNLEYSKMQLTELLLPLFIHFKNIESESYAFIETDENFLKLLEEDTEIKKIASDKLFLANSELAYLLLEFLNNQYAISRYSNLRIKDEDIIKNYEKLRDVIFNEYNKKVKAYRRVYGIKSGSVTN